MSIIYNNSNVSLNLDETNGNLMSSSITTTSDLTTATSTINSSILVPISPTSNDDDSKSEYTDADEMSAPTELLAEFLSSIMQKDYKNALKYCKLILEYEPNNSTAKDFYPHILAKMSQYKESSASEGSDENFNYTSSEFVDLDNDVLDNMNGDNISQSSSDSISTTNSSSSDQYYGDEGGGNSSSDSNSFYNDNKEQEDSMNSNSLTNISSSSSKADPRHHRVGATYTSTSSSSSSSSNCSHKEDTSHSYTSLLLEDDENLENINNNNNLPSSSAPEQSPSSSPLTRKIVDMIRAKCIPAKLPHRKHK